MKSVMTVKSAELHCEVALFVDGKRLRSASDERVDVINPSNGQVCLTIPAGCAEDADIAVRSARHAFDDGRWSNAAPSFRKNVLQRLAGLIEKESPVLDSFDATEMGKPIGQAAHNAAGAAGLLRFYAEAIDKVVGDVYGSDHKSVVAQRRVPRGVVAAVVPWNFPTYNVVLKIAPALAAGNTVVLKPSELASQSAMRIAELAVEAGLPAGVLNVVPGLGSTAGEALGLHSDVDMLTFTGSTQIGKRMLQYAGQSNMKVVVAECGGKSPQIVFDDGVDLDSASDSIAQFLLLNQGQICSVGSRLLVQRSIADALVEKIRVRMSRIVMGDARDPRTTFGPLASAKQCARVMQYIETAEREGARRVAGGRKVLESTGGFFVEPTMFQDVSPSARLAQEEIFGPVLSVFAFDDEAQAVQLANSTMYGLAAYVWTANLSTGMRMAKAIRSSVVISAAPGSGEGPGHSASYEPAKQSGIGAEGGMAGLEAYLRRQTVWINHA